MSGPRPPDSNEHNTYAWSAVLPAAEYDLTADIVHQHHFSNNPSVRVPDSHHEYQLATECPPHQWPHNAAALGMICWLPDPTEPVIDELWALAYRKDDGTHVSVYPAFMYQHEHIRCTHCRARGEPCIQVHWDFPSSKTGTYPSELTGSILAHSCLRCSWSKRTGCSVRGTFPLDPLAPFSPVPGKMGIDTKNQRARWRTWRARQSELRTHAFRPDLQQKAADHNPNPPRPRCPPRAKPAPRRTKRQRIENTPSDSDSSLSLDLESEATEDIAPHADASDVGEEFNRLDTSDENTSLEASKEPDLLRQIADRYTQLIASERSPQTQLQAATAEIDAAKAKQAETEQTLREVNNRLDRTLREHELELATMRSLKARVEHGQAVQWTDEGSRQAPEGVAGVVQLSASPIKSVAPSVNSDIQLKLRAILEQVEQLCNELAEVKDESLAERARWNSEMTQLEVEKRQLQRKLDRYEARGSA